MRPMLATPGAGAATDTGRSGVPQGPGWTHELKWDGVRLIADIRDGTVALRTRSGRDVSVGFPELASLRSLAADAMLDGEAIVWRKGLPSFAHVVDRVHINAGARGQAVAAQSARERPVTYVVFDLLRLDHLDITGLALRHRRAALESVWTDATSRTLAQTYPDGQSLFAATREQGLEGVVSKRLDSVYQPGVRSRDWLKFAHRATASLVIGGWRAEVGSRRLGAVLVGTPSAIDPTRLHYRGRVGSGLAGRAGHHLATLLADARRAHSPFLDDVPSVDAAGATWVEPVLVIDVAALNAAAITAAFTADGGSGVAAASGSTPLRLRQPSYQCLRPDLSPSEVSGA